MKEYVAGVRFGIETDTYDIWGNVLEEKDPYKITKEKTKEALLSFQGEILQTPPAYSAVRVKGKRLYEYARAGEKVEAKKRKITVDDIRLLDFDKNEAKIYVRCSRGTYIRSICHDLGKKLGCCAAMSSLVRISSGPFRIEDSVSLSDLEEMKREEIEKLLLPIDFPLSDFGRLELSKKQANDLIDGKRVSFSGGQEKKKSVKNKKYCVYSADCFIGVAEKTEQNEIRADKIFCTEKL